MGANIRRRLMALLLLVFSLYVAGCVTSEPPYPNVVPIDTTGNFGAR
jgi:hypothetical protein